jgi:hypothetical protein
MGAIIGAGAKLASEQAAMLLEMRAALQHSPEIVVQWPEGPAEGRTPIPAHVIRRGAGSRDRPDGRAEALLAMLNAVDVPIETSARRGGRPPVYGDEHYREIAERYAQAWRNGDRHPTLTIAKEKFASRSTAAKWVSTARKRGFLGATVARRAGGISQAST